ncbi:MAG TPA: hypothetical protein VMH33_04675 [Solirubrobacterales bacterium]|nr:hypothetical protein [Solirubrobacterales bacterium]
MLIGQAEESPNLDFKREVTRNGRELAKDIAAMTVDGGVLIYGITDITARRHFLVSHPGGCVLA